MKSFFVVVAGSTSSTRSELKVRIIFRRNYIYHLSQSFMQSFLMGLLTYFTFWIDISDFQDRFMGSLTCLLVLASLMSALTQQLPKTSYYKVIDYWLLFFLLSTSVNISIHIVIDRLYQKEKMLLKAGSGLLQHVTPAKTPGGMSLTKTYGPMANDLFNAAKNNDKASSGEDKKEYGFPRVRTLLFGSKSTSYIEPGEPVLKKSVGPPKPASYEEPVIKDDQNLNWFRRVRISLWRLFYFNFNVLLFASLGLLKGSTIFRKLCSPSYLYVFQSRLRWAPT